MFTNWDQGFDLNEDATNAPNWDWSANKFVGCAGISIGKTAFQNNQIIDSAAAESNSGAVIMDGNTSLTNVQDLIFEKDGAVNGHAIYLASGVATSLTFDNYKYTGYEGTSVEAALFNDSGGLVTITINGGATPTVKNGSGASTDFILTPVDTTITVVDDASPPQPIENALVFLYATNNANYFFEAAITITGSGTTATVTHTTHGLTTGDLVWIDGIENDDVYNGAFSIIVTGANEYTYTTQATITSTPAVGTTKIATYVILKVLTNASGIATDNSSWTSDQPIAGWARKRGTPNFAQGPISGTIDTTDGFSTIIGLRDDD